MNKKELIKNLITDIQEIYSIINKFEHTEPIHPLDIDLSLSKVRNLYELLLKLKEQDTYITENQKEEILTASKHPKQKDNPIKEEKPAQKPETAIKEEETNSEETERSEKQTAEPELITKIPEEKDHPVEEEQPNKEKQPETSPEIVADKFHSKKFVHDDFAEKNSKNDVSSKMQSKAIHDINSAIGLNDKFIFIRELFHNNKEQYHETIQILNNFDTFDNAVEYLTENFNWDKDDPHFERLKELVRRKYAAK